MWVFVINAAIAVLGGRTVDIISKLGWKCTFLISLFDG